MLKVVVVTDGPYGERANENISKSFKCEFLKLEPPTSIFAEEVKIPEDARKTLESGDIVITYVLHPDLTLELVERLHDMLAGSWLEPGGVMASKMGLKPLEM